MCQRLKDEVRGIYTTYFKMNSALSVTSLFLQHGCRPPRRDDSEQQEEETNSDRSSITGDQWRQSGGRLGRSTSPDNTYESNTSAGAWYTNSPNGHISSDQGQPFTAGYTNAHNLHWHTKIYTINQNIGSEHGRRFVKKSWGKTDCVFCHMR